jgi:SMI1/KNR4 family protein SUKH-1
MAEFEQVKAGFWDQDRASDYLVERPLTDEALADAERTLGRTLPAELVTLLRIQNGGGVAAEFARFPTAEAPFRDMYGIGPDGIPQAMDPEYEPEELVPLTGDGHWWIGLDYRAGPEPAVSFYDVEDQRSVQLADDFRSFLEALVPDPDAQPFPPGRYYELQSSSMATKIRLLRSDLARFERGERSLDDTRLWMAARPAEVFDKLPWRRTRGLSSAVRRLKRAPSQELGVAVEGVVSALEALLPLWRKEPRVSGRHFDE